MSDQPTLPGIPNTPYPRYRTEAYEVVSLYAQRRKTARLCYCPDCCLAALEAAFVDTPTGNRVAFRRD